MLLNVLHFFHRVLFELRLLLLLLLLFLLLLLLFLLPLSCPLRSAQH
jgi:hypothetical protein